MTFGVNIIPKDNTVSLGTSQNKWKINGVDNPKLTDTTYSNATTSAAGLMSAADKTKINDMGMISYGTCSTSASAQVKVVTISNDNWQLKIGSIIGVKYSNTNTYNATTSDPVKLNVNGTGEKQIYYNSSATPTGTNTTAFGYANQYRYYMYDGTYWVFMGLSYHDNTFPSAYCSTSSGTAAKTASCSGYSLLTKSYLHIVVTNANTSASALTLNVNGKGAKYIYINGVRSSSSNYTLPAGSYIIYYDGTSYYFRTDGKLTADITGTASNVTGTIDIEHGGTGATTAPDARASLEITPTNIGAVSKSGGIMEGNLAIEKKGSDSSITFKSSPSSDFPVMSSLEIGNFSGPDSTRRQGLYSYSYFPDDTSMHTDAKWLIYRDTNGDVVVNGSAIDNVAKSGDTMTGDLNVTRQGSATITVNDTIRGHSIQLRSLNNGLQGLWTPGYYNGSSLVTNSEKWLIYRNTDGDVVVDNTPVKNILTKTGDTMTGNLTIEKNVDPEITLKTKPSNASQDYALLQLGNWTNTGHQGLYSYGYYDQNQIYHNDPSWLIYRNGSDGKVHVNGTASDNVAKSGDTMTGNLVFERSADSGITLKSKPGSSYSNYATLQLGNWSYESSTKDQGLYSTSYYDNNNNYHGETTDRTWLIYRSSTDGKVYVENHYNKSEIDNKFTDRLSNFKLIKVQQTVTITAGSSGNPAQTTITINNIPSGKNIYEVVSMWLGGYRIPYITNSGVVHTWISGINGSTITFSNLANAWSNYDLSAVLLIY